MRHKILLIFCILLFPVAAFGGAVTGVTVNGSGTKPDASAAGDLWPMTWAADGNHYTAWGDGDGFNDTLLEKQAVGFAKVEGSPSTTITGTDLFGFDFDGDDGDAGKCNGGIISIGSTLYAYVQEQANGYNFCKIGKSTDYGSTWVWGSGETTWGAAEELFNDDSDGGAFAEPGIIQMGQGYDLNTDGYIYGIGDNDDSEPSDSMYLFRVQSSGMQTRANYEFFVSRNAHGDATWGTFAQKQPVVTDAGDINWGRTIVYHKWSDSYLMTLRNAAETAVNVWNAPNPWGPWTEISTISVVSDLGYSETLYSVNIVPGWFSSDGTSGYITASGTSAMDTFRYWAIDITFEDGDTEDPFLAFSDLADGCNNCLTDDQVTSQGAIVTVWGNRLGDKKTPTREIYVGSDASGWVKPAHYYYWGNADSTSGGGPSNLYTSHKMQEISFALSSSTPTGAQYIKIVTDGESSNEIPFYVRNTGSAYFVSESGSNGNAGTWGAPKRDVDGVVSVMSAGDVAYFMTGDSYGDDPDGSAWPVDYLTGTSTAHYGFVAYPGATVESNGTYGFSNSGHFYQYLVFSKIITDISNTNDPGKYTRYIAMDVKDELNCNNGYSWFNKGGQFAGAKYFGITMTDKGGACSSGNQDHTTYFTNADPPSSAQPGFEFAWNVIDGSVDITGIHLYLESDRDAWDRNYPIYIHHNIVKDQASAAFDFQGLSNASNPKTGLCYFYGNLTMQTGHASAGGNYGETVWIEGWYESGDGVHFFNNTFYAYSFSGCTYGGRNICSLIGIRQESDPQIDLTLSWINNIAYDLHGLEFYHDDGAESYMWDNKGGNIWYSENASPPSTPSWDTAPTTTDPQFTSPSVSLSANFTPAVTSPAVDAGVDLATIPGIANAPFYDRDLYGKQITTTAPDIGAIQYAAGEAVGDTTAPTVLLATVPAGGTTIVIEFNENVVTTGYATGDFNLDCTASGTDIDLSTPTGGGSGRTFTLVNAVKKDDTCNLDFAPAGADSIEDESGNDLDNITDGTVTNNSTYEVINSVSGAVNLRIN